jgi:hypothetical protein
MTGNFLPMSNPEHLVNAIYYITPGLATFEGRGIPTASSAGMIAPPTQPSHYPPEVGIWSDVISDAQGNINYKVTATFSGRVHTSALTLFFDKIFPTEFSIRYFLRGNQVDYINVVNNRSTWWQTEKVVTYDRWELEIHRMSEGFVHFRMPEIEFGASLSFSRDKMAGTVRYIEEFDLLGTRSPISQLSFSLVNIGGTYDDDNPDKIVNIDRTTPIYAMMNIHFEEGDTETIPLGLFYIREQRVTGNRYDITAQDSRAILQDKRPNLTLLTTKSLGDYITEMLKDYMIRHVVDPMMFSVYVDQAVTLDPDMDALTMLNHIRQYADVQMWMDRAGSLHIGPKTGDNYGTIPPGMLFKWPAVDTRDTVHNVITVLYAEKSMFTLDLRTNINDVRLVLNIDNPLIITQAKAMLVAARIAQSLPKSNRKRIEWRGDPTMETMDRFRAVTRFNDQDEILPEMVCTRIEHEFTKGLKSIIQGVHE